MTGEYHKDRQINTFQDMGERKELRTEVMIRGMLEFQDHFTGQPCIIRDLNSCGAKIELQNNVALPKDFTLHVDIEAYQVECHLIWQKPPFAGIVFTSDRSASTLANGNSLERTIATLSPEFLAEFERRQKIEHRNQPAQSTHGAAMARSRRAVMKSFGKRGVRDDA